MTEPDRTVRQSARHLARSKGPTIGYTAMAAGYFFFAAGMAVLAYCLM